MNSKKPDPEDYYKYLLNKQTVSPNIIAHIETLTSDDDVPKFAFHKIMINNWPASFEILFDILSDYFTCALIPVSPTVQDEITSFYTSSLNLILKIIKLDFNFLYERIIVNIDIIYNDKTSVDFFNKYETMSHIVSGVVSRRFLDSKELDLSDFCNDAEFLTKKINFYKLSLLSNFKILMLRIGKETKTLNLSSNNLREPPAAILNFFIKGNLTAINLSNNNILSLNKINATALCSYKNKLEKLWLEGNPLCNDLDAWEYVKRITSNYPKLIQLDGVQLTPKDITLPPIKNFLVSPDQRTKEIVEKFLSIYFRFYDELKRPKIGIFYKIGATLSIVANIPSIQESHMQHYTHLSRNILNPAKACEEVFNKLLCRGRLTIIRVLQRLPRTVHDRTSFTVDVLRHDETCLILVVDGMYKELNENYFRFRRTFTFSITKPTTGKRKHVTALSIRHEMFNVTYIFKQQIKSFMCPPDNEHPIALDDPDAEEREALLKIFIHISRLKMPDAEKLLKDKNWDIRQGLIKVMTDLTANQLHSEDFMELDEPDTPNACSLIDMVD